jgi:hypothetical protein
MKKAGFFSGCFAAIVLLGCVASPAFGQSSSTTTVTENMSNTTAKAPSVPRYYHLVFVVKELEGGKVVNSRNYAMSIGTLEGGQNMFTRSIRTGTRIPIEYDQGKFNYLDVGVSIDSKNIVDLGDKLGMDVSAEISSVQSDSPNDRSPIQQNKWNSQVVVMLGKPTVLFASDEVTSKRTLELELTATEIK